MATQEVGAVWARHAPTPPLSLPSHRYRAAWQLIKRTPQSQAKCS